MAMKSPLARVRVVVRLEGLAPVRVVIPEAHGELRMWSCADELICEAGF
jgi:hypothetical protein